MSDNNKNIEDMLFDEENNENICESVHIVWADFAINIPYATCI